MNDLRIIIFSIFLAGLTFWAYPAQVNETEALKKAQLFYNQKKVSLLRSTPTFQLSYTCKDTASSLRSTNTSAYFYIFNVGDNQGFVIVSGEDATKSILGYSNEGTFSTENIPANLKHWLEFYQSEIKYAKENELSTTPLESSTTTLLSTTTVAPLLGNIKWNQNAPYNIFCPYDKEADENAVTGCVATAMAQIMRYYKWPVTGTSSHSYTSTRYGSQFADFSKTNYDWNNMSEEYGPSSTAIQDTAVARLMYHFGVAVDMNYDIAGKESSDGSGAFDDDAATALIKYFGYDPNIQIYYRTYFTSTNWKNLIKSELDAKRPVYYSGQSEEIGHAFVCDGYDSDDLFHINWGWGGISNGYFELSALEPPSAKIESAIGGFNQSQSIIAGIQKPDGIDNITYQIGMYKNGLSSTLSTINNITNNTFDVNFGYVNWGINDFSGNLAVGLYKDGVFQKVLKYSDTDSVPSNTGSESSSITKISLSDCTAGNYRIYCIFRPTGSSSWSSFNSTSSLNNYLDVVISGTVATIQKPTATTPFLALTQKIQQMVDTVYENRTANFSITVQNTGSEFYSNIGLKIYSESRPSIYQFVDYGVVCIPSGETKTFNFSGNITCSPGSYYAIAAYDSTNSYSKTDFKAIGPNNFGRIPVTILSESNSNIDDSNFIIYPNPAKNQLNIQTSKNITQAKVSDLSGRTMLNVRNTNTLQVSSLKPGIYLLHIETNDVIQTLKFIKE